MADVDSSDNQDGSRCFVIRATELPEENRFPFRIIPAGFPTKVPPIQWSLNPEWHRSESKEALSNQIVDFVPRMQQDTKMAEIMIALSSATIFFIPSHDTGQPIFAFFRLKMGLLPLGECSSDLGCLIAIARTSECVQLESYLRNYQSPRGIPLGNLLKN